MKVIVVINDGIVEAAYADSGKDDPVELEVVDFDSDRAEHPEALDEWYGKLDASAFSSIRWSMTHPGESQDWKAAAQDPETDIRKKVQYGEALYSVLGYDKDSGAYEPYAAHQTYAQARHLAKILTGMCRQGCLVRIIHGTDGPVKEPIDCIVMENESTNEALTSPFDIHD